MKESKIEQQIEDLQDQLTEVCRNRTWTCKCGLLNKVGQTPLQVMLEEGYSYSQDGGGYYSYEAPEGNLTLVCKVGCLNRLTKYDRVPLWEFSRYYRHYFGSIKLVEPKRGH